MMVSGLDVACPCVDTYADITVSFHMGSLYRVHCMNPLPEGMCVCKTVMSCVES